MKQMTLSDRIAIESGLLNKKSFGYIANRLNRHPTSISNEVKHNRTKILSSLPFSNDCRYARNCSLKHVCGDEECRYRCCSCRVKICHEYCDKYVSTRCNRFDSPPYVCNGCTNKTICIKERYIYSAINANEMVKRRRSDSRSGPRATEEQIRKIDEIFVPGIKKGQPMMHIYAEHKDEMPVSLRTLYNYIESNALSVKNMDLRRKVRYRQRSRRIRRNVEKIKFQYRRGRTYVDFENIMKSFDMNEVVEMDTLRGIRESGKRLLTMFFRKTNIMLLFLMPDGKSESVIRVFDFLEANLGYDVFCNLFGIILTDNGSEFKNTEGLETSIYCRKRTSIFFCDPMASWQKAQIEKNHEYIRYVLPKGKSMSGYDQEDITLLMNNINSTKRKSLSYKSPYELVDEKDTDMQMLMNLLKMHPIPPDEVHLKPDLLIKKY